MILLEDGAFERARSLFEHLTRLEPRLADGWANLAEVEIADGKFPAALDAAEHALSLDASYKLPRYLRGRCLQELGREKEAQEELARAGIAQRRMLGDAWSERIPEFAVGFEARFARAVQLLQSDRNAEARAAFELLMHERPRDVRTLGNLAMAQAATGNLDAAIVSCDAALGIEPNSATLHAARARVMLGGRRVEDALLDARRATELDAQDASNFELFGFALAASGDNAAALTAWSESLRLDPSNADLHRRVELLRLRR